MHPVYPYILFDTALLYSDIMISFHMRYFLLQWRPIIMIIDRNFHYDEI